MSATNTMIEMFAKKYPPETVFKRTFRPSTFRARLTVQWFMTGTLNINMDIKR